MSLGYSQKIIIGYKVPKDKVFQHITETTKSQSCECNKDKTKFCPICGKKWEEFDDEEILDIEVLIPELYDEENEDINTESDEAYDVVDRMSNFDEDDFCIVGKIISDIDPRRDESETFKLDLPTKEEIDRLIGKLPIKDCEFGIYFVHSVY